MEIVLHLTALSKIYSIYIYAHMNSCLLSSTFTIFSERFILPEFSDFNNYKSSQYIGSIF